MKSIVVTGGGAGLGNTIAREASLRGYRVGILRFSPVPPMQIGNDFCGPLGLFLASKTVKYFPWKDVISLEVMETIISSASSKRSKRSVKVPSSIP